MWGPKTITTHSLAISLYLIWHNLFKTSSYYKQICHIYKGMIIVTEQVVSRVSHIFQFQMQVKTYSKQVKVQQRTLGCNHLYQSIFGL